MKLYTIETGLFKLDGGAMFGVVPKSMWNKVNPADDNNMCTWSMRSLLIEDGNRLILVDTGLGNKQDDKFFSHYSPHGDDSVASSLKKHGFSHDDITDVFLTHLHFDHCGGAIVREGDKLVPAFKNATYWSNELHWNWAVHPNEREKASFLKENILPIQESGQLQFLASQDGIDFADNIKVRYVNGHTEAMMLPQINYNGQTILFCADLIPSQAHISMPWVMAYDMRPMDTLNEKRKLLNEAIENNWLLFLEHDRSIEMSSIQMTERGIRAKDIVKISDL